MIDLEQIDLSRLEATVTTDRGDLVVRFHADKAPRHVRNFAELAQKGFYDGVAFHRVIRNFMVQTGCPNSREGESGTPGTGGPGYQIDAEFNDVKHERGVLSMARAQDPNSAGSQFFIVHADHVESLDGNYTAFGYLKDGLDVLDAIATVECDFGSGGERSKPVERITIQGVALREAEPEPEQAEEPAAEGQSVEGQPPEAPPAEADASTATEPEAPSEEAEPKAEEAAGGEA